MIATRKSIEEMIETLRLEKSVVEDGGYGRHVGNPWRRSQYFRDSITCPNVCEAEKIHLCGECFLIDYVHAPYRGSEIPCHFIRLNAAGDTVDSLQRQAGVETLEETLVEWLDRTIEQLEQARDNAVVANFESRSSLRQEFEGLCEGAD